MTTTPAARATARLAALAGTLALALLLPAPAAAQQAAADARWAPWTGCWSPAGARPGAQLTCIVPVPGTAAAELVTVAAGKVVSRDRVEPTGAEPTGAGAAGAKPTGAEQVRTADGCTGRERATWSADGRRIFLRTESCPGKVQRTTTGVMAFLSTGEWLEVQGVSVAGGPTVVRVMRYAAAPVSDSLLASVAGAAALPGADAREARLARLSAGAPVGDAQIIEASRRADAAVVEAWLLEGGQRFWVDARQLLALQRAGVPGRVTDALVALSYPRTFGLARAGADTVAGMVAAGYGQGRTVPAYIDPYGYGGYSPYRGFGAYPYGYGGYYGYSGYYGFGGYGNGGYWNAPVVIVPRGIERDQGQAVNGSGYTHSGAGTTRSAVPRGSATQGMHPAGSARGSGASGTASPPPRTASPPRTAHPKP